MSRLTTPTSEPTRLLPETKQRRLDIVCCLVLLGGSLLVGLYRLSDSGPQWRPDGPKYANDAAMCRDWLLSGEWLRPIQFAEKNYVQYPVHALPYHPPGYPMLLGLWYLLVGMSYASARCFVALCLGTAACILYGILRRQALRPGVALVGSLLMITTPELVRWSRSAMSEIPALTVILGATYCFVRWIDTRRPFWAWIAFAVALFAFFCRPTTAGVLPAWVLYPLLKREYRRAFSPHIVVPAAMYFVVCLVWFKFVRRFARHELGNMYDGNFLNWENISVWISALPSMVGWLPLGLTMIGLIVCLLQPKSRSFLSFWLLWFVSYYMFQVTQTSHFEARYFVLVIPSVCALAAGAVAYASFFQRFRPLIVVVVGLAVVLNVDKCGDRVATGKIHGLDSVAEKLAELDEPGNVLLASPHFNCELIFRFRCHEPRQVRQMIRGDRTLWIMVADYSGLPSQAVASKPDDVLDTIRKGRVRYLLTAPAAPSQLPPKEASVANRTMALAHETCMLMPDQFTLVARSDLNAADYGHQEVYLWRVSGDIQPGPSELPVISPTAGLRYVPADKRLSTTRLRRS